MAKKEYLLQITTTRKMEKQIREAAKDKNIKMSDFGREAIGFYLSFDPHFMRHMKSVAEKMRLPVPIVITNFITVYIAAESAALEAYGTSPTIYKRAFQYTESGELITGNDLSILAFDQSTENLKKLKEKLEESAQTGKPAAITLEEAAFIADHRRPAQLGLL